MAVLGKAGGGLPKGVSEYRKIRREGYAFVDKTPFIADVLDSAAETTLFTRPRRFGKTLNMLMLKDFLERGDEDVSDVFADTETWRLPGDYLAHFRRYPVIWLSLKQLGGKTWDAMEKVLAGLLEAEFERQVELYPALEAQRAKLLAPDGMLWTLLCASGYLTPERLSWSRTASRRGCASRTSRCAPRSRRPSSRSRGQPRVRAVR